MKKNKAKRKKPTKEEIIEFVESRYGVKVLDIDKGIMEYEGKKWRPIKNQSEFFCICFDNEPVLNIGECSFVAVDYQS